MKGMVRIFAVVDIVAAYARIVDAMIVFRGGILPYGTDFLSERRNGSIRIQIKTELSQFLSITFLRIRLIEDMILLIAQIDATETVAASDAIVQEI
jgi:hypothetical protein